jgi:hypothetical protein
MSFRSPFARRRRSALKGRSVLARVLSGAWLLLYVGLVAGAPVADGFVDHGQEVVLHVEDADGGHCPASHGAEACDICQLAQGLRAISTPLVIELPRVADVGTVAVGVRGVAPAELHFLDGRSSRAPPLG